MYEDEKNKKKNSDTEKKETGRDSGGKPCSAQDIADCNVIRSLPPLTEIRRQEKKTKNRYLENTVHTVPIPLRIIWRCRRI